LKNKGYKKRKKPRHIKKGPGCNETKSNPMITQIIEKIKVLLAPGFNIAFKFALEKLWTALITGLLK